MKQPEPLTKRQRDCLDAIVAYTARNGISPTMRELGNTLSVNSTNCVAGFLRGLERKGWIRRTPGVSRGIVVVSGVGSTLLEVAAEAAKFPPFVYGGLRADHVARGVMSMVFERFHGKLRDLENAPACDSSRRECRESLAELLAVSVSAIHRAEQGDQ